MLFLEATGYQIKSSGVGTSLQVVDQRPLHALKPCHCFWFLPELEAKNLLLKDTTHFDHRTRINQGGTDLGV